jgi:hypothetical protein
VLATGGRALVDKVEGMEELVPKAFYEVYTSADELSNRIKMDVVVNTELREKISKWIEYEHSCIARAKSFRNLIDSIM